jgi:hypothetical protein
MPIGASSLACFSQSNYLPSVGWKREGFGQIIVNKTTGEEVVSIVVVRVEDGRINTGPVGNYNTDFKRPLSAAKFQFIGGRPDEKAFAADYDKSIKVLESVQNIISSTKTSRNLLSMEGKLANIHFSAGIFEPKDTEEDGWFSYFYLGPLPSERHKQWMTKQRNGLCPPPSKQNSTI